MSLKTHHIDIAIFGGGISGLWILNRLSQLGYSAVLFENQALGAGQTLKSQGIIHGGIKYALQGLLSKASDNIAEMPNRFKQALTGEGEIDLRQVKVLSPYQYLFSCGSLTGTLTNFFASKALSGRTMKIPVQEYPEILQNKNFKGQVYRLEESVLDTVSLIRALSLPYQDRIYKIDENQGLEIVLENDNKTIARLALHTKEHRLSLQPKCSIFTAGQSNEALTSQFEAAAKMQLRPLHMVVVKLPQPYSLFAHCIEQGTNPRVTITTHHNTQGEHFWYLGGGLAETGIHRNKAQQLAFAKEELKCIFPWIDLASAEWQSFFVNRAEEKQAGGKRPESFSLQKCSNHLIAWPTKLVLAPMLTDAIITRLKADKIQPDYPFDRSIFENFSYPELALPPWEAFF